MANTRTDLALEAAEVYQSQRGEPAPGIAVERRQVGSCSITRVDVLDSRGEKATGKPPGRYITLEDGTLRKREPIQHRELQGLLVEELQAILSLEDDDGLIFVLGLGNRDATPDALGPAVVQRLLVTRHLREVVPEEVRGGLRPVCALAPGVLGTTGIETGDIVSGLAGRLEPAAVIVVDALASASVDRILSTIQLADTGIQPGSGIGNLREAITPEALGIPVVALGIPTVVGAHAIAAETVDGLLSRLRDHPLFKAVVRHWDEDARRQLMEEVLSSTVGPLMVTPKEIDVQVRDASRVVAGALNAFLHPSIDDHEAMRDLL